MGPRVIGMLAFITFIHLGARAAAPASVYEVSDLPTPTPVPAGLVPIVDADTGCSLLVVFDPSCPACARAVQQQAERATLPLDVVWVAETEEARQHFVSRVHPEARLVVEPTASELLRVNAVPAAFLVADGAIRSSATISGTENLDRVAAQCTRASGA